MRRPERELVQEHLELGVAARARLPERRAEEQAEEDGTAGGEGEERVPPARRSSLRSVTSTVKPIQSVSPIRRSAGHKRLALRVTGRS
jgi:hypothetical protein